MFGGKPINVVVFSWPSDGKAIPFMSYYSDREDARSCGAALARTYLKLWDFMAALDPKDYCDRSLHLLAHSMGNLALQSGVENWFLHGNGEAIIFDLTILAAAEK